MIKNSQVCQTQHMLSDNTTHVGVRWAIGNTYVDGGVGSGSGAAAFSTCAAILFATPAHAFAIVIATLLPENGSPFMAGETAGIKNLAIPANGYTGVAALTALAAHSCATCSASSATASISGDAPASCITVITTVASFIAVDATSAAALVVAAASAISSAVGGCCGSRGCMGGGSVCHDGAAAAAGTVSSVVGVNEFAENIVIC